MEIESIETRVVLKGAGSRKRGIGGKEGESGREGGREGGRGGRRGRERGKKGEKEGEKEEEEKVRERKGGDLGHTHAVLQRSSTTSETRVFWATSSSGVQYGRS